MLEHETVVLQQALPAQGLQVGDVGVIVHVYEGQQAYEVEFASGGGDTLAVLTLAATDVRRIAQHEILHVRTIPV